MILPAQEIRRCCIEGGMLTPFRERYKFENLSGGLSVASYDVALAEPLVLPAKGFRLASTQEYFRMPDNVCAVVHDKSTHARYGIALQNTFIDPGWCGYLTLEVSNNSDATWEFEVGTPIAQIVFQKLVAAAERTYDGKYQFQEAGPQRAR